MTGHTYKLSDSGIREVLDEWKLFYPRRFAVDPSPNLPAAIEVVLGGVRMRYPSQVRQHLTRSMDVPCTLVGGDCY